MLLTMVLRRNAQKIELFFFLRNRRSCLLLICVSGAAELTRLAGAESPMHVAIHGGLFRGLITPTKDFSMHLRRPSEHQTTLITKSAHHVRLPI